MTLICGRLYWRHYSPLMLAAMLAAAPVQADIGVAGVFPGKALLMIDGVPQTVALGRSTEQGVKVVAIQGDLVTLEVDGQQRAVRVGQYVPATSPADSAGGEGRTVTLFADGRGHFFAQGTINGGSIRFLVDTGASLVSLGAGDARRLGIDASRGQRVLTQTANGTAVAWRVKLDRVRLGEIVLHNVDGMVHERDMPIALLGMSFLNRMDMQRDGRTLVLKRRY